MAETGSNQLFEDIVSATGLALMIGPGAVQRALAAVGVREPQAATRDDYRRALPYLKARMAFYMQPGEVDEHMRAIEALLA